jgi:hypothetical protein|tara:strand:- start:43 stop:486 length:444 start_codon:yes stop_codon:yes gene_type:complete
MTSQINVDTIVDKAGTGGTAIKIGTGGTAVSEGGANTTSVVQGLAKHWAYVNQATPTIHDSLNASSITDTDAGKFNMNIATPFTSVNYTIHLQSNVYGGDTWSTTNAAHTHCNWNVTNTSSLYENTTYNGAYTDSWHNYLVGHGDLS